MNRKLLLCTLLLLFCGICLAQRPAFPLKVSENGRYFVDTKGTPFLYHTDTGRQLFTRLTLQEALEYLTLRKSKELRSCFHPYKKIGC
jgi:hypothetical protein